MRLIDADALISMIRQMREENPYSPLFIEDIINAVPTIIKAEEE